MELGLCEHAAGRYAIAIEAYHRALHLWERIPEELRLDNVWRLMSNLAASYTALGEMENAEHWGRRAIHQCEQRYQDSRELAQCRLIMASVCRQQKNFEEADQLIELAQTYYERTQDGETWQAYLERARLNDDQDRFVEAGKFYHLSCEMLVKEVGQRHVEVGRAMESHAAMLARSGHSLDGAMMQARAAGILDVIH
jgi:tetratricopeptide (TPR) repeat protein